MTPADFSIYFAASAGAGAALLGLIFVAVSIVPEHTVGEHAPVERQAIATSAYTALVNAFFVSLAALLPGQAAAYAMLVLSILSVYSTLNLGLRLLRQQQKTWTSIFRRFFLVGIGLALYAIEVYYAGRLFQEPNDVDALSTLASLLLGVYGLGVARAWQLVGGQHGGLTGLLNPLRNLNQSEASLPVPSSSVQPDTTPKTIASPSAPSSPKQADTSTSTDEASAPNTSVEAQSAPKAGG